MAEAGIDMSTHRSKHVEEMAGTGFDYVITVCDSANRHCPVFPGRTRRIHAGFDDPPRLAAGAINEETALAHYRRVRDEIRDYVAKLPEMEAFRGPGDRIP
jgi:arsenate reductase